MQTSTSTTHWLRVQAAGLEWDVTVKTRALTLPRTKSRLYVFGPDADELYGTKTDFNDDGSYRVYQRRTVAFHRELASQVVEKLGLGSVGGWSRKAACSCGCSPSFSLSTEVPTDVFVTVEKSTGVK